MFMPNTYSISNLLEIKDLIVDDFISSSTDIHLYFHLEQRDVSCPFCNSITNKVHDYRTSVIKDAPIQGKFLLLHYKKRRYHCNNCNHHFNEPFNLLPKYCRITNRLCFLSVHQLREVQNISSVARQLGISVSTVFRRLKDISFPKPNYLPEVLSIDEFKGNAGGEKFQAIFTDPVHHKVLDILPSRTQTRIAEYIRSFKNRKQVKYFIMDMNRVYLDVALTYLPNATIVIDKFHVVRYITWALENVRKRIQKDMHPSKRKYFKRSRRILLSHYSLLSSENKQALEIMLQQSYDLAQAYYLKELFYEFMSSENSSVAKIRLKKFILSAQVSQLSEFNATLTMLGNWSKYILNAFDFPYSNGFTEGCNNKIKVIKRNGYGFHNFKNFRNRILLSMS